MIPYASFDGEPRTESGGCLKLTAYLAATGQALIAAGTFLVAKDATSHFTPLQLSWFRIVLSGVLISLVYLGTHRGRPRPPWRDLKWFALLGLLGVTANQMLFLFGINLTTPLHASLLYAFTPVIVMGGATLFLGENLTWLKTTGVALAVAGVGMVLASQGLDLSEGVFRGDLIVLAAVFAWAAYTLAGKRVLGRYDSFTVIVWVFRFGALSVLPALPWVFRGFDPATPGLLGWSEVLYLSAITSGVAFTLWYIALKRLEATQVAVFTNLQAPLTALLAWWVLGSVPEGLVVVGGLLVLAGVWVVQIPSSRLRSPAPISDPPLDP
jgi:drug/metabolite transporter (DMT)-like permease